MNEHEHDQDRSSRTRAALPPSRKPGSSDFTVVVGTEGACRKYRWREATKVEWRVEASSCREDPRKGVVLARVVKGERSAGLVEYLLPESS